MDAPICKKLQLHNVFTIIPFRCALVVLPLLSSLVEEAICQQVREIPKIQETAKPVPRVQVLPLANSEAAFVIDGKEVTRFHFGSVHRRPFLFPVFAQQKESLTRIGHPHDAFGHSHHNSIWMSHANIAGINFWADQGTGLGKIVLDSLPPKAFDDGLEDRASFTAKFRWISEDEQKAILLETRKLTVLSFDGVRSWGVYWESTFEAATENVTIEATPFGMLSVRMAKSIGVNDGGGRILNSEKQINEQEMFRKPARWCDYSGRVNNSDDGVGGVTLMNFSGNPSYPSPYHVRDDGWMGACLNKDEPIVVAPGNPLQLKYAIWVHGWDATSDEIEKIWSKFAEFK